MNNGDLNQFPSTCPESLCLLGDLQGLALCALCVLHALPCLCGQQGLVLLLGLSMGLCSEAGQKL